jgi:hypothetical protein
VIESKGEDRRNILLKDRGDMTMEMEMKIVMLDQACPARQTQEGKELWDRLSPISKTWRCAEVRLVCFARIAVLTRLLETSLEREQLARADMKHARKADRKQQKEALDELVPRASAGTRERQLEKKKELNGKMSSFRDKSPGAVEEVAEGDLMGGGEDGIEGLKKKQVELERKQNEREVRQEDILRVCSVIPTLDSTTDNSFIGTSRRA